MQLVAAVSYLNIYTIKLGLDHLRETAKKQVIYKFNTQYGRVSNNSSVGLKIFQKSILRVKKDMMKIIINYELL